MSNLTPMTLHDTVRQIRMQTTPPSDTDTQAHRYEETAGQYKLRSWHDGREISSAGPISEQPAWLRVIVDVGRIGSYMKRIPAPPPERIVWFDTDANGALISFTDFTGAPYV